MRRPFGGGRTSEPVELEMRWAARPDLGRPRRPLRLAWFGSVAVRPQRAEAGRPSESDGPVDGLPGSGAGSRPGRTREAHLQADVFLPRAQG